MVERRRGEERRNGQRRLAADRGLDRRRGIRRALVTISLAVTPAPAGADIYTRINSSGVLEATNVPAVPKDFKLAYRSKGRLLNSPGFRARPSGDRRFDAHIEAASLRHGVSLELVRAIIQVESGFDHRAVSTAGARGLMQLMPGTARRFGVIDSFDARQNIFGGTRYLRVLLDLYRGDISLSAAAYNAGETAVARHKGIPPYKETQDYVRKVNALLSDGAQAVTFASVAAAATTEAAPRRVYYRWTDGNGVVNVSQSPPATGAYSIVRWAGTS